MIYTLIQYRNTCDLAGALFSQGQFWFSFYLNANIGKPVAEIIEEGREDGDKNFIADFKKLIKKYEFTTVVPEYQYDCLCMAQLHDTIRIKNEFEELSEVFDFTVRLDEWMEHGDIAQVTVTFSVRYDIRTNCCDNEFVPYVPCLTCGDFNIGFYGAKAIEEPAGLDRTLSMFGSGVAINGIYPINNLYFFRYSTGWTEVPGRNYTLACFTYLGKYYQFYWDGQYFRPCFLIKSLEQVGANLLIKGWCAPNTWVRVYISTDGITYTAVGSVTAAGTMESTGVTLTGLAANTYYLRFLSYNNNCNYGYSDVQTIVKS